jgi:hypothetical protein
VARFRAERAGLSVHGITEVNRKIVRELLDNLDLVGAQS